MDRHQFEKLVDEALAGLPPEFAAALDNVAIIVADIATSDQLFEAGLDEPGHLLGLYEGIPLTERPNGYAGALPDRISIFRAPIEAICSSDDEIREQVRQTVIHELGHYFGMDEHQLRQYGIG